MNLQKLLSDQKEFFLTNKTKDISFRIEQLKKFKSVLKNNEESLLEAIYDDFGKSEYETQITELSVIYGELNEAIQKVKRWSRKKRVPVNAANFPAKSCIFPEPYGNTLVIGAWNYPFQLSLAPIVSSLAAGNTVILKPSEIAPTSSAIIAKLINSHFPAEYFAVVEGGVDITTELLSYEYDKIFFTGSSRVGKIVYQAAAKHLTPVTLELGGKSPTFVLSDCNINLTAKRIVWGKFLNAGQTCVAPDYILVHKSIEKEFLQALQKFIQKFFGDIDDAKENYVRIINDANFTRLESLIDKEKVYCGAKINREKKFIAPTVLHNVTFDDEVMKEEIFGPILPVIAFDNLDDVIMKVKRRPKPLSCYIYSKNKKKYRKILTEISFGGGAINDSVMHLTNGNLPFGGVGSSGMGSYHHEAGFKSFSHYKSVLNKSYWFEPRIKYFPYSKRKLKLIKFLSQ